MKSRVRTWISSLGIALALVTALSAAWIAQLDHEIQVRFREGRFAPPIEFYSAPELIRRGHRIDVAQIMARLKRQGYRLRQFGEALQEKDYSLWSGANCRSLLPTAVRAEPNSSNETDDAQESSGQFATGAVDSCLAFRHSRTQVFRAGFFQGDVESTPETSAGPQNPPQSHSQHPVQAEPVQIIALSAQNVAMGIYSGVHLRMAEVAVLTPELFAQYLGSQPILRRETEFSRIPNECKHAVLAIEDPQFLEHAGVSATSILRAAFANIRAGRFAQGGSTITQQLVKNYFLTEEKTLRRKLKEFAMALVLENRISKEKILETYLNIIYMGQSGAFEVRGFGAAAVHYFNRPIESLGLAECSLLAATLNSPGNYSPFRHPEKALKRRARVLEKMVEHQFVDASQAAQLQSAPLPTESAQIASETAPYFVKAVRTELFRLQIDSSNGIRVYTTLKPDHQDAANSAVLNGLKDLQARHPKVQLEGALVASDPQTGFVTAIVGGRGYGETQFNRAIEANRQIGSLMKPLVFLSAIENLDEEDLELDSERKLGPMTVLSDSPLTVKYDGQTWSPKNYDGQARGSVPAWYALAHSLNLATAALAQKVRPAKIIETARALGATSKLDPVPSISLGAFEMPPIEVLKIFTTFARSGSQIPLSTLLRVDQLDGTEIYSFQPTETQAASAVSTAIVNGMMRQTVEQGTARSAKSRLKQWAAGKTGTTNDKKDAWFAGFTPETVAVVWVGSDTNQPTGLTGASGALPIWTDFIARSSAYSDEAQQKLLREIQLPAGARTRPLTDGERSQFSELNPPIAPDTQLIDRTDEDGN